MTADRLEPGEPATILRIDGEPSLVRRLMELGLVPGTVLTLVRRAPMGDPIEVAARGIHLSLRLSEASRIHVASH
ncbi:MAG: ferrous iron transport protein A [Candidatus Eisenbacteria bacterium]|uniref:Ferrous iron transport protein A n=1 Tax=Eiseniibacteriota bacterium TaxID=2212470 RepID=A0A849SBU3_UNCEI|nr:ferrous iron transport protein A [Candidatus Eisenbacteria bacterium]